MLLRLFVVINQSFVKSDRSFIDYETAFTWSKYIFVVDIVDVAVVTYVCTVVGVVDRSGTVK